MNPTNIALSLLEARNRKISKTHSLLHKMLLSLSACLQSLFPNFRSNFWEMFNKKGVPKKLTGKQHSY